MIQKKIYFFYNIVNVKFIRTHCISIVSRPKSEPRVLIKLFL